VLERIGADSEKVRNEVVRQLGGPRGARRLQAQDKKETHRILHSFQLEDAADLLEAAETTVGDNPQRALALATIASGREQRRIADYLEMIADVQVAQLAVRSPSRLPTGFKARIDGWLARAR
jgi:hypothetical protein